MSIINESDKLMMLKEVLKRLETEEDIEVIRRDFKKLLEQISPFEIPILEQKLVLEGYKVENIIKLCDLHLELFREYLRGTELKGIPEDHPLDIMLRENDYILKKAELLGIYIGSFAKAKNSNSRKNLLNLIKDTLYDLKKIRIHYRKIQMLIFPYLERRGLEAIPRVLWSKEDGVIKKIRELIGYIEEVEDNDIGVDRVEKMVEEGTWLSREIADIIFRENKILFPSVWELFRDGEWALIYELGKEIGYIVEAGHKWMPTAQPVYPYEVDGVIPPEKVGRLPIHIKQMIKDFKPDSYKIEKDNDLKLDNGFLDREEIEALFRALPIEITYANNDDRIRFYSSSIFHKGFIRTKTIIGRPLYYCHPPRLEKTVRQVVDQLRKGDKPYREFWTRMGDRIIRVLIVPVKDKEDKQLGTVEIVEDLTDIINNPDKIRDNIVVL